MHLSPHFPRFSPDNLFVRHFSFPLQMLSLGSQSSNNNKTKDKTPQMLLFTWICIKTCVFINVNVHLFVHSPGFCQARLGFTDIGLAALLSMLGLFGGGTAPNPHKQIPQNPARCQEGPGDTMAPPEPSGSAITGGIRGQQVTRARCHHSAPGHEEVAPQEHGC